MCVRGPGHSEGLKTAFSAQAECAPEDEIRTESLLAQTPTPSFRERLQVVSSIHGVRSNTR